MINLKKYTLLVVALLMPFCGMAASMADLWRAIPASLVPYLSSRQINDLADLQKMGVTAEVVNELQSKSSIDTLTTDYLRVNLNGSVDLQLKRLARQGGDSVVCVVKTWYGKMADSELSFYDTSWQPVEATLCGQKGQVFQLSQLNQLISPATGNAEVLKKIEFVLASARLHIDDSDATVVRQSPLVAKADKEAVEKALQPIALKWTGEEFVIIDN